MSKKKKRHFLLMEEVCNLAQKCSPLTQDNHQKTPTLTYPLHFLQKEEDIFTLIPPNQLESLLTPEEHILRTTTVNSTPLVSHSHTISLTYLFHHLKKKHGKWIYTLNSLISLVRAKRSFPFLLHFHLHFLQTHLLFSTSQTFQNLRRHLRLLRILSVGRLGLFDGFSLF